MTTLAGYLPLALLAVLSALVVAGVLGLSRRLNPLRPTPEKLETYECGEQPRGDTHRPIDIKYYIYVLVFLVFDVEIVFLVPWAVTFRTMGPLATVEITIFVAILLAGWAYVWKERLLQWLR